MVLVCIHFRVKISSILNKIKKGQAWYKKKLLQNANTHFDDQHSRKKAYIIIL